MARADRRLRRSKARQKRSTLELALEAYKRDPIAFMKAFHEGHPLHSDGLAEVIRNLHHIIGGTGLATARIVTGMSRPEIQNIPIRTDTGHEIAKALAKNIRSEGLRGRVGDKRRKPGVITVEELV